MLLSLVFRILTFRYKEFHSVLSAPQSSTLARMENHSIGLVVHAVGTTGVLHQLTGVIARHQGDITSVEIMENRPEEARTYFEVVLPAGPQDLVKDLEALPIVHRVELVKTLQKIYGKRI